MLNLPARLHFSFVLSALLLWPHSAWSDVLVRWSNQAVIPLDKFGISDLVFPGSASDAVLRSARKNGYHVYIETDAADSTAAAEKAERDDCAGLVIAAHQAERAQVEAVIAPLRAARPKLKFLILNRDGKQPDMRGSLVIQRNSVLEVSSPTAQPWIDTNLAMIKIEQRADPRGMPFYSFSWTSEDFSTHTAVDYALAVAEAGAFHAGVVVDLGERLQESLIESDQKAWTLWNEVRSYADFYAQAAPNLVAAANLLLVADSLDVTEESMNLLARHNIPFRVLLPADLKSAELSDYAMMVVLAKPDKDAAEDIAAFAARGKTVVVVDAHGSYAWQKSGVVEVNEHTKSYGVGSGKVLELSEPVIDPETFAQDIRRVMGNQNMLINLWNGLTTVAVPYRERGPDGGAGKVKVVEFVNYSTDPIHLQVQVKGDFASIRFDAPGRSCCEMLTPVKHGAFTEFVIPDLRIAGRVYLEERARTESQTKK